jgi:hypothetical protein
LLLAVAVPSQKRFTAGGVGRFRRWPVLGFTCFQVRRWLVQKVTRVIAVYKSVDRIQTSIMLGNFKNISVQQSVFESFCPVVCTAASSVPVWLLDSRHNSKPLHFFAFYTIAV